MEFGSAVLSGGLGELAGAAAIAALKRVAAACSDNSDGTPVSVPAGGWPELTNWAAANASVLAAGRGGIYETAFQTYLISPQGRSFLDHALAQALRREPLDPSGPLFVLFKKSFKQFHLEPHSSSTTILIYYTLLTKSVDAVVAHCLPEDFLLEAASESSALHQHTILCLNAIEDHLATIAASTESHRRDIDEFVTRVRSSTRRLLSTIVPPSLEGTARVEIEKIHVLPSLTSSSRSDRASTGSPVVITYGELRSRLGRVVVLGDPGGGKSTLATRIAFDISAPSDKEVAFLIELRDYAPAWKDGLSILDYIERDIHRRHQIVVPKGAINWLATTGGCTLILDGLDELLETRDRAQITAAVESFCAQYPFLPVVVTSRRVGYREAPLEPDMFQRMELGAFNERQVTEYAEKWFGLDGSMTIEQQTSLSAAFLTESESVEDLRSNPLMLGLMCNIYRAEHYIPRNRPEVYEKCALMLFDRWDRRRGIDVRLPFTSAVEPAMRYLANWIYADPALQEGVSEQTLVRELTKYLMARRYEYEPEAREAAGDFVTFLRNRAWVFMETGTTPAGDPLYQFAHRTFLEYFTASQLSQIHDPVSKLVGKLIPRIRKAEWDVVSQLAVQISSRKRLDGADEAISLLLASGPSLK